MDSRGFRFGDWQVDIQGNSLSDGSTRTQLEPRVMDVLRYLCRHAGAVIPPEELLQAGWGTAEMGDNPVHKAIAQLRRALGDSSTEPRYIETVRKRGYRAIAPVAEDELPPGVWQNGSPFRGLEAFQEAHAAIFFGRYQAVSRLRELVLEQAAGGCAMALVLGPSGAGKTSLVRAGLMPQLMEGGQPGQRVALGCVLHLDCADLGEGSLYDALAAVLVDTELNGELLFDGSSAAQIAQRLAAEPQSVAAQLARAGGIRIGLFVDRLEALFRTTQADAAQRLAFIEVLELLARDGALLLVLACRNDFYPELIELSPLMALKARGGHFDLVAPNGAELAQIVREPARAAQLSFERDPLTGASLDDVLCDAARGNPDTLPLLQYCLNELYRQRSEAGALRFSVFRELGGIEGALGVRAEQVVSAQAAAQQESLPYVLSLLVNVGEEQGAVTGRRAPWSALHDDAARDLVRAMVEARLFVSELSGGVPSFGVAHEALLRRWPRVAAWVEQHRHSLQVRTRLGLQADRWASAGRPRDLLLPRGSQVNQAASLLALEGFALSAQEKEFIGSSLSRVKLGERLRMAAIGAIAALAVLSGVLGLSARSAQLRAEQHRNDAEGLMGFMLGDFIDKLRPLGRLDLLDSVSQRAQAYLSNVEESTAGPSASLQRAKWLQLIAETNITRAKPDAAAEALAAARAILERLDLGRSRDKELLRTLGANAFYRAQIHADRQQWDEAVSLMKEYLAAAQRLMDAAPDDADAWKNLGSAHNSLGAMLLRQGKTAEAAEHLKESVQYRRRALQATPDDRKLVAGLANGLSWLAETRNTLGQSAEAMQLFGEEQALLDRLHKAAPEEAVWTSRLSYSLVNQGDILLKQKEAAAARQKFLSAERLVQEISLHEPGNRRWKVDVLNFRLRGLDTEPGSKAKLAALDTLSREASALGDDDHGKSDLARLRKDIALRQRDTQNRLTSR
ncbi:nSTAND1 domain-containing NTPase [Massilia endophytica]|uniref:nSTAND1 domain-containing NTPase n=1 Tax=Massilia endophytica TaxID=2899220 RepID=UPI001E5A5763|nr:winged helix-turn-helix domain-containing protein [Massilia endophytica]UGQ48901.1 winged helix-turn-helix domain-containing protein [Massilia endophytica]